ncbi:MAG: DUF192 domain-containing protein [Alphaproteobacteria bacterium]|nr:DUF192 domain-containing protein [Alphaproteobacteria bacterium]
MRKILALAVLLFAFSAVASVPEVQAPLKTQRMGFVDDLGITVAVFNLEVADTEETRRIGLMNRTALDPWGGMMFDFGAEDHFAMWMKNTLIPLDMIFLNFKREVIFIAPNRQPGDLSHVSPCHVLLEEHDFVSAEARDNFWNECVAGYESDGHLTRYVVELNAGASKKISLYDVLKNMD